VLLNGYVISVEHLLQLPLVRMSQPGTLWPDHSGMMQSSYSLTSKEYSVHTSNDSNERIAYWRNKTPHAKSALDKLEAILAILEKYRKKTTPIPDLKMSLSGETPLNDQKGKLLIAGIDTPFAWEVADELARVLLINPVSFDLEIFMDTTVNLLQSLTQGQHGRPTKLNQELLSIIYLALKPQLEATAAAMTQPSSLEDTEYNNCPLCGGIPYISDLRGEHRTRYMHCVLCGTQWIFPRVRCVHCNNTNNDSLGYFKLEKEQNIRVDFCNACKGYIKNIDCSQHYEPVPMPVEDTATLEYDYKAIEAGYHKFSPNYIGRIL